MKMIPREEIVFNDYIKAMSFEKRIAFGKGVSYAGPDGKEYTKERIIQTDHYVGYVDGREGHTHRYKGAHGRPDAKAGNNLFAYLAEVGSKMKSVGIELDEDTSRIFAKFRGLNTEYDEGYRLGISIG